MKYSSEQQSGIKSLLSDVLFSTKPEEVFLVDHVFDRPVDVQRRSDALAFGGGPEVILWMYPIFHVLCDLAKATGKGFSEKWGEQLAQWLWGDKPSARLEPTALANLRIAVVQRLSSEGVSVQDSERVGDSVLAALVARPELLRQVVARR